VRWGPPRWDPGPGIGSGELAREHRGHESRTIDVRKVPKRRKPIGENCFSCGSNGTAGCLVRPAGLLTPNKPPNDRRRSFLRSGYDGLARKGTRIQPLSLSENSNSNILMV
jgi:hypothetical protein